MFLRMTVNPTAKTNQPKVTLDVRIANVDIRGYNHAAVGKGLELLKQKMLGK